MNRCVVGVDASAEAICDVNVEGVVFIEVAQWRGCVLCGRVVCFFTVSVELERRVGVFDSIHGDVGFVVVCSCPNIVIG